MIVVYQKVTPAQMAADVEDYVPQIEKWFTDNPKRRICRTQVWYGRMISIRKGRVRAALEKKMAELIAEDLKKTPARV